MDKQQSTQQQVNVVRRPPALNNRDYMAPHLHAPQLPSGTDASGQEPPRTLMPHTTSQPAPKASGASADIGVGTFFSDMYSGVKSWFGGNGSRARTEQLARRVPVQNNTPAPATAPVTKSPTPVVAKRAPYPTLADVPPAPDFPEAHANQHAMESLKAEQKRSDVDRNTFLRQEAETAFGLDVRGVEPLEPPYIGPVAITPPATPSIAPASVSMRNAVNTAPADGLWPVVSNDTYQAAEPVRDVNPSQEVVLYDEALLPTSPAAELAPKPAPLMTTTTLEPRPRLRCFVLPPNKAPGFQGLESRKKNHGPGRGFLLAGI